MRHIAKGTAPPALLAYVKTNSLNQNWDSLPKEEKDEVRGALLAEQRGICCYCMQRITEQQMKVEHYLAQSRHREASLAWSNLLAACSGGEGGPVDQHTCDTKKGNASLRLDPRNANVARNLHYLVDGTITSDDEPEKFDLNEHLNLNVERLKENRKRVYDALKDYLRKQLGSNRSWTKHQLEKELEKVRSKRPFNNFMGAQEYWLLKFIRGRSA